MALCDNTDSAARSRYAHGVSAIPPPPDELALGPLGERPPSRWRAEGDPPAPPRAAAARRRVDLFVSADDVVPEESRAAAHAIRAGLASSQCTEIHGLGPDQLYARYAGQPRRIERAFASEADYNRFVKQMVEEAEAVHDWETITRERRGIMRMRDGASLTVIMPPFADYVCFTVRKQVATSWSADDLVARGSLTTPMLRTLQAAVAARANILIVGEMGAGKTTMLSMLAREFPPSDRVAVIEEVPEIEVPVPQCAYFTYQPSTDKLDLSDILDSALYSRFDRVIVGEVHLHGLAKMLEVMIIGAGGSMSTYHAGSVEQALERMRIGLQLENPQMTADTAMALIRNALDLVVVLERPDGVHRCREIAEIDWRRSDSGLLGRQMLFEWNPAANGYTVKAPDQGGRLLAKAKRYGVTINPDWFLDPRMLAH